MNVEEKLKHIGTYWDIYSYLGTSKRSLDEIKKHLMIECGKPESTARANISGFKSAEDSIADISRNGKIVRINIEKINALEKAIDCKIKFSKSDYRRDELEEILAERDNLKKENRRTGNKCLNCERKHSEEVRDLNDKLTDAELEKCKLELEYLKKLMAQPVLITNDAFVWYREDFQLKKDSYYSTVKENEDLTLKEIKKRRDYILIKDQKEWDEVCNMHKAKGIKFWMRVVSFPISMYMRLKRSFFQLMADILWMEGIRKQLARDIVEQRQMIICEYNGKLEPFKVVPERYLADLEQEVNALEQKTNMAIRHAGVFIDREEPR